MKEQLLLLQELQQIDSKIKEIDGAIRALPEKLKPAKQDLAKLESLLAGERKKVEETEAWKSEQEDFIRREEDEIRKAKLKVQASKNTRDFAASSREVDNRRRMVSECEDEVLKVIDVLATTRANMEAHAKDVEILRGHVAREEAEIDKKIAELQIQRTEAGAGRGDLATKISPPILKKYERVLQTRGVAVVPVRDGVCGGCHMSLPPQLTDIIARFESLESCPACHRLLFRVEPTEAPPTS